jgi:hypothetical protein
MDDIKATIKSYVLIINPGVENNAFLDYVIAEVIDRALVYMNRYWMVKPYNEESSLSGFDTADIDFDEEQYMPIPTPLFRPLAKVVLSVLKEGLKELNEDVSDPSTPTYTISSISDNGQQVVYREATTSYLESASDSELFNTITPQLDNYRLAKVIGDGYTKFIHRRNFTGFLR